MQSNFPAQYQVPLDRTANVPITEGIHLFTVKSGEEKESSAGNPMWVFNLACQDAGEEGKEVTIYLVLTEKARWKFELFLDAMNAPKTGSATINQFFGRQLRAEVKHEDYEGKPQARIGEMFPVTAVAKPAMPKPVNPATQPKPVTQAAAAVAAVKPTVAKKPVTKLPKDATE